MRKCFRVLAAAAMTLILLGCGGALAAEGDITVQLDGQELTFTDAVPQVRDQRTFLPFRAVFEAMGAEVSNKDSVITATRGGRTLTMTLGETAATVTEGDAVTPITMDVAPYVDNITWRTYVPVRFAAQAFGCAVGWDQVNSTAIIVDMDRVVDSALEGKSFTYMEKLMDYSRKYNEGIWDMEATFGANIGVMGVSMPMSGSVKGAMEDSEKLGMDMNVKMDVSGLIKLLSRLPVKKTTLSAGEQVMLDTLKTEGMDLSLRGDLGRGDLYMNINGDIMAAIGMNADDWYKLDMASLVARSGMDWTELMAATKSLDYTALVKQALSSLAVSDSVTAYTRVKEKAEEIVTAVSDGGFVKEDDRYTAAIAFEEGDAFATLILVMEMRGDAVTGYVMSVAMESQEEGMTVAMDMTVSVDDKDRMTAEMHMDKAGLATVEVTMEGGYTPGRNAPAAEPPAGAKVEDFMKLAGMGAIGI